MDIPTEAQLLERIAAFLERHDMAPTRFGRLATGEPQLIKSIEGGRSPSLAVVHRILTFMAAEDAKRDATAPAGTSSGNGDDLTASGKAGADGEAARGHPFLPTSSAIPAPVPSTSAGAATHLSSTGQPSMSAEPVLSADEGPISDREQAA